MAGELSSKKAVEAVEHGDTLSMERQVKIGDCDPLFEPFDMDAEGGVIVDPETRQVYEIGHPKWKQKERLSKLPYEAVYDDFTGEIVDVEYTGARVEPNSDTVTLGLEVEVGIHHEGEKYYVTQKGDKFVAPSGKEIDFGDVDAEAYKVMVELKTEMAKGAKDLTKKAIELKAEFAKKCQEHGIYADFMSSYPSELDKDELTDHPYVENADRNMPSLKLFVCMSEQLNIGWESPEAGRHALSMYQQYAPIMSLVTGAAPMFKGELNPKLADLFGIGSDKEETNNITGENLVPADDYVRKMSEDGAAVYDVREFIRIYGSTGGSTWTEPAPISNLKYLERADNEMRTGEILTSQRLQGAHRDRARNEHMEICSLSGAGGNTHILRAAHELVVAYLMKQQKNFNEAMDHKEDYETPDQVLNDDRERAVELSHANNVFTAMSGKESRHAIYKDGQYKTLTPAEMLKEMIAEAGGIHGVDGNDGSEGISKVAACELFARLQPVGKVEYSSAEETFDAFFNPYNSMTATEAFHYADKAERAAVQKGAKYESNDPEILAHPNKFENNLIELFGKKAQQHAIDVQEYALAAA